MSHDPRDVLSDDVFFTYYDAFYEELLAYRMLIRLKRIDDTVKVLGALTTGGGILSSVPLWQTPYLQPVWAGVILIVAGLIITHKTLEIGHRINEWERTHSAFTRLRLELERLRHRINMNPEFSLEEFEKEYFYYTKRYADCLTWQRQDSFETLRVQERTQQCLNKRLNLPSA